MKNRDDEIVTNQALREVLQQALSPVYEILARIEVRFNQIDNRLDELDERIEGVDRRFDRLMLYLDHRFEPLEAMAKDYPIFKDSVLHSLEWLVDKQKESEVEQDILSRANSKLKKHVDNHENRILILEDRRRV